MSMQESLRVDLKNAMKARDTDRTGAIRILMGEFARQKEKVISDEQVIGIVKKLIKSERELLAAQGNEGSSFLTIMEEYLPKQASEEEIFAWVQENIDFSSFKSKMQAMKPIMQHFGSAVDGNQVKKVLEKFD
ncbi:MAG: GatB/YqeY domain-containing protein [Desulfobulbaceae bacterium]|nr:GatB/YqeY domain-containing protein [Desulfobulbaceae bacterium]